ncbi:MAG: thiamine-phosphate kinase [Wenzhouxiangellaceae bacterium]|nr:thiamine-phosphate kinase [Wenzhouxiangellaceae bacterium]
MDEFALIEAIRRRAGRPGAAGVAPGTGDAAAALGPTPGHAVVATVDQLVEGRHFDDRASPADVGHLSVAVNLSDLAAMGARPRWLLLALTLPDGDADWIDAFLDGFLALADTHGCTLVGGNLARGPLQIGVTALGECDPDRLGRRHGASEGDRIVVTGTLGDAAAALKFDAGRDSSLGRRLLRPSPRVGTGLRLAQRATALIDVSDGLLADLGHLLGDLGATIDATSLPTSTALREAVPDDHERWGLQLSGGGDYELLFTLREGDAPAELDGVPLTTIGRVTGPGPIRCLDAEGGDVDVATRGWNHFGIADDDHG